MVGEQGIPAYNSIEKYTTQNVFFNDVMQNAVILSELPSKNLNWEKTFQTDIGLEIGFLNNRFNLEIDYYSKLTKDLLLAKPLPGTAGGSRLENVGEIENKGFEIAFTSYNIQKNDFKWNSTLTLIK
jgi:outer membrane receptor protein involved in Fe transport